MAANTPDIGHAFTWKIRVYYEDTDTGGVVFYANYLKFFERARTEWLRALGFSQQAFAEQSKAMFVVKNTSVDYRIPAKLDDELVITARIEKLGRASVTFMQEAWRMSNTPSLLASGTITIACVHTETFRPQAIPADMLRSMQEVI